MVFDLFFISYIRLPLPCTWVIVFMSCKSWLKQWTLIVDCVVIIFNLIKFVAAVKIIHFTMSDQNIKIESANTTVGTQEGAQVFLYWMTKSIQHSQSKSISKWDFRDSPESKIPFTFLGSDMTPRRENVDLCGSVCMCIHACVTLCSLGAL